jgi:hypothetical protein
MGCTEEEDDIDFVKSWPWQTEDERPAMRAATMGQILRAKTYKTTYENPLHPNKHQPRR